MMQTQTTRANRILVFNINATFFLVPITYSP